jgi:hypothetical protein
MKQLQLVRLIFCPQYIQRATPRRRVKGMVNIGAGEEEGLCAQTVLAARLGKGTNPRQGD